MLGGRRPRRWVTLCSYAVGELDGLPWKPRREAVVKDDCNKHPGQAGHRAPFLPVCLMAG